MSWWSAAASPGWPQPGPAREAGRGGPPLRVTVLEATGRSAASSASARRGVPVDEGAESLLAAPPRGRRAGPGRRPRRRTWSTRHDQRRGLDPGPDAPAAPGHGDGRAGRPAPLAASGLLTGRELARVRRRLVLPRTAAGDDVSVGRYVAARLGRAVVDRLVEPLLGGVYAGRADELSLQATLPQLAPLRPRASARCWRRPGPAAAAADAGRGRRRCSGLAAAASGGCRPRSPTRRPAAPSAPAPRPRAAPDRPRRLAARRSGRPARPRRARGRRRGAGRPRAAPPPGCCAAGRPRPRLSSPRSATPAMARGDAGLPARRPSRRCRPAAASWCRRWRAARSRR